MKNITKVLAAFSILFAFGSAQAGELTVTGNMETTYNSQQDNVTGNPIGMDRELKFAGSTELDNGITVSVMQDTNDALAFSNSQMAFSNSMGTIYVGSDSDPMDSVDDITPSAYEEANGSGSGTYVDVGHLAGQMGVGVKASYSALAINAKYYKKADGVKNADNSSSGVATTAALSTKSAYSVSAVIDAGKAEPMLDGLKITTAYSTSEHLVKNSIDHEEATLALNYAYGPVSFGTQHKHKKVGTAVASLETANHRDVIYGLAYAINDSLSVSYNRYSSRRSDNDVANAEQETDAINIGYTMGGMTIGIQEAKTDNAGYVSKVEDDSRTVGISVAF
ncbi:porin [Pelagibacteraceae bacterium]|nr:porin [Pelagibacteraceae bacterium]